MSGGQRHHHHNNKRDTTRHYPRGERRQHGGRDIANKGEGLEEGEAIEEALNPKPARSKRPRHEEEDPKEAERRARMARLRAENDHEEETISKPAGTASGASNRKTKDDSNASSSHKEQNDGKEEGEDDEEEEEAQMRLIMGISGFGSTKGEKVEDNHSTSAQGAAAKHKARKYRQYMNRKNGFNRPLDAMD